MLLSDKVFDSAIACEIDRQFRKMSEELVRRLELGKDACRQLSQSELTQLGSYLELLAEWTGRVDLVSPAPIEALIDKHLIDSLAAFFLCQNANLLGSLALDVGSGAGLPGIVYAIMVPEIAICLCEPREKRVMFLREVGRRLSLDNLSVFHGRLEDYSGKAPDFITWRALGDQAKFLRLAREILAPGGNIVEMLGPSWEAKAELFQLVPRLKYVKSISYTLPLSRAGRQLVVWRKSDLS